MRLLASIGAALLLVSCTSTERIARLDEVHQHESWDQDDEVRIVVAAGARAASVQLAGALDPRVRTTDTHAMPLATETLAVLDLRLSNDSAAWTSVGTLVPRAVPLRDVRAISFTSHGQGLIDGFGLGALIGAGVGIIAAEAVSAGETSPSDLRTLAYLYFGGGGIALGAVTGLIAGAIVGSDQRYEVSGE